MKQAAVPRPAETQFFPPGSALAHLLEPFVIVTSCRPHMFTPQLSITGDTKCPPPLTGCHHSPWSPILQAIPEDGLSGGGRERALDGPL